jgi:AcrR family transcriptional regulator
MTLTANPSQERILVAAERLFFRYGYLKVTTEEIAREAAMSKKTLYEHFPAKSAIVTALAMRAGRSILARYKDVSFDAPDTFESSLSQLLNVIVTTNGRFSGPLLQDLSTAEPALYRRIAGWRRRFLSDLLLDVLTNGQRLGCVRQSLDVHVAVIVLQSALDTMLHPDGARSSTRPIPPVPVVLSILLHGVSLHSTSIG